MTFEELDAFKKGLKKLLKKYRNLPEDLDTIRKVLKVEPGERPPFLSNDSEYTAITATY